MAYYLLPNLKFNLGGIRTMAKVSIKFLTAHIADNQVEIFLKKEDGRGLEGLFRECL